MSYTPEVTTSVLWQAWKEVRKLLPRCSRRDITDFIEFDINPDEWIGRLVEEVNSGRYEPGEPFRFTIPKTIGFSRHMTFPQIPDLVLYRAITGLIYDRLKLQERENVYFARTTLSKKRRQIAEETGDPAYMFLSGDSFVKWKEYHQYRKLLLLEDVYPHFVLTDITNYFASVLYDRAADALYGAGFNRNLVGLLFFLLERFSPRDPYNESPRIGLPVDEFDCSRTLAHVVLYPHDERMAESVGEEAYVRWMDDQTIGVDSYAAAVKALGTCGLSLSRLHLTPNAGKTKILSLRELAVHFHLEANEDLDDFQDLLDESKNDRPSLGNRLTVLWRRHRSGEENGGEWSKVLARFYLMAGVCRRDFLLDRATEDILRQPTLARRTGDYFRVLRPAGEYLEFVLSVCTDERQIHSDVSRVLVEGLLKVEPSREDALRLREFASQLLAGCYRFIGWKECAAIAPLLILRFGDKRSRPRLKARMGQLEAYSDPAIGKAISVVYASYGEREYTEVMQKASKLSKNYLGEFVRMLERLRAREDVPDRFKIRTRPAYDSVAGQKRVDMRKLLVLRLLRLNQNEAVKRWLEQARYRILDEEISTFDQALVNRLLQ
ncbi:MAG: RNA-directed DNA polymerase [Holophagales bacterium]|nr:RNA-directed DNA polymerase [Holophagales bacterium]MYG31792.1 RNA-directed DNA polymerase [Holophagales bacterium]MYI79634.1 RNA-directed DNA polymerase [Holophagales bacterium]